MQGAVFLLRSWIECTSACVGSYAIGRLYGCLHCSYQVYHVFELEIELPKYAMYAAEDRLLAAGPPASHVSFTLQHPVSRVASWVEGRFNTKPTMSVSTSSLDANFTCMRTRQPLVMRAAAGPAGLKVSLYCESMELAGELLQVINHAYRVEGRCNTCALPGIIY